MSCDIKRSVSLYSYQDEFYNHQLDLEGCLRETAKTGAAGVELLAEHPRVRQEEIDRIKGLLREYSERINSGDMSFSTMARLYSEDTGSARQGGEMDYMSKMDLDPAFANVAWTLNDPKKVYLICDI